MLKECRICTYITNYCAEVFILCLTQSVKYVRLFSMEDGHCWKILSQSLFSGFKRFLDTLMDLIYYILRCYLEFLEPHIIRRSVPSEDVPEYEMIPLEPLLSDTFVEAFVLL